MNQSFNPNARWDRHIPETSNASPQEPLDEKIQVLALFKQGKAYPRAFFWNNKEYKITAITYNWQERRGQETINYFSVTTGSDLYQISFNAKSLGWRIDKIIS